MIKIKFFFHSAIITSLLVAVISCVKSPQAKPNLGEYHPPVALSDYCFFKPGTWWLYQDSISGAKDCVYVAAGSVQTYMVGANDGKDYTGTFHHYYTKTIDGIGDERDYDIYDEDAAESAKCCGGRYYCEVHWNRPPKQSQPGIYFDSYVYMFNVFTNGVTGGLGVGEQCWARGEAYLFLVNNELYNNVVIFEISKTVQDQNWNVHPYRFKNFISKYVGVVKRIDLDSNRTWLLTSYHVAN